MINISRYTPDNAAEWDEFVRQARNGTMLLLRGYMDYHQDRFTDHSLMVRNEMGTLIGVLPANVQGDELWSHQGLTYGGLILGDRVEVPVVGQMFKAMLYYIHSNGFRCLHYKPVPTIYHRMPSEEDEYWLWRYNARLEACNISAAIDLRVDNIPMHRRKRSYYNQMVRAGYTVCRDAALEDFWPVLTENLQDVYGAQPVHTLAEMQRLQQLLPDGIQCWTVASPEGIVLGGTVLYVTAGVAHTQYISASEEGKRCHALDLLFVSAINHFREQGLRYFDFGTSNERGGMILNESLILQKGGFGGRGVTYKCFCVTPPKPGPTPVPPLSRGGC